MKKLLKNVALVGTVVAAGYVVVKALELHDKARIDEACEDEFEDDFFEDGSDPECD